VTELQLQIIKNHNYMNVSLYWQSITFPHNLNQHMVEGTFQECVFPKADPY